MKASIKTSLIIYIVLITFTLPLFVILAFMLPAVGDLYADLGVDSLPVLTRILLSFNKYWFFTLPIALLVEAVIAFIIEHVFFSRENHKNIFKLIVILLASIFVAVGGFIGFLVVGVYLPICQLADSI